MKLKTNVGDIFSVAVKSDVRKFFQLIAFDSTQLNSDVIRCFKHDYSPNDMPTLEQIVDDEVEFYAHCVTKFGLKMKLWEKVGNLSVVGDMKNVIFRDTNDYGVKVGEEPIKISHNWYVWRINDKNFINVGKLDGENRQSEIGIIVNPYDIIDRLSTGKYNFVYPGFL